MHPFGAKMREFRKTECIFMRFCAKSSAFLCKKQCVFVQNEPNVMRNTAPMLALIILPTSAK